MIDIAWKSVNVGAAEFKVPSNWDFVKKIGEGAYGIVAAFQDPQTQQKVAVKKITDAFRDLIDGKRILREVRLLRTMKPHDNIVQILDMYPPEHPDFEDVYIVQDLMETDLHRVICSRQPLKEEHHRYISYQVLRGLLYLHSANVVHRDLKPANILINKNCDAKICDFGLARGFSDDSRLTDYVVTRWYRAPEVVLDASHYDKPIDVWAMGCILCELVGRRPIFPGSHYLEQIKTIVKVIGTPTQDDLDWLPDTSPARPFLARIPAFSKTPWAAIYPDSSPSCAEVMERMLTFHPLRRATVQDVLYLPFYSELHMPEDEPTADEAVDWEFDHFEPTKRLLQNHLYLECAEFHPDIIARDQELLSARGIDKMLER